VTAASGSRAAGIVLKRSALNDGALNHGLRSIPGSRHCAARIPGRGRPGLH